MTSPRVLVVDDQAPARRLLRDLLAAPLLGSGLPFASVDVVAEATDGDDALEQAATHRPDLVFVDVGVRGRPGLDVLTALGQEAEPPAVVVTVGTDGEALDAYQRGATDVLVKPLEAARVGQTLHRAVPTLLRRASEAGHAGCVDVARAALTAAPLERLFVREARGLAVVATREVVRVEAQGDYALVHTRSGARHLAYVTLAELEARLCPRTFLRVHRSHIVHLDRVVSMEAVDGGRYAVVLDDGAEVTASRSRSRLLREVAC